MFAYIVANLTGRTFKARYLKPDCDITDYLVPNKYDWYLDKNFTFNKNEMVDNRFFGQASLRDFMAYTNLTEKFKLEKKYHVFVGNLQYLTNLKRNKKYKDKLSWMNATTPADMYAAIYTRLFKLSTRLKSHINDVLNKALPTSKHRLLCVHVRLGRQAFSGDPYRMTLENLHKVWSWMKKQIQTDNDRIFVTGDSHKIVESAKNQSFSDRIISIPGAIIHSNKFDRENISNKTILCSGMERLILEYHMLMNCDVFVRGYSGLSVIASVVRGTDEGLYCLKKTGDILPCERNQFNPAFL